MSCEAPTPLNQDVVFAAATDDVMIFSTAGAGKTSAAAVIFVRALSDAGGLKNPTKDIDDAMDAM